MAIKIGRLFGTSTLIGTDDDDLLIALAARTTLVGGAGKDILLGGLANDILVGGPGADFLSGGLGTDTVDYSGSNAAVTVNLATGKASGGDAQGDTLVSIENAIGSAFDDRLTGGAGNNVLTGGDGNDVFVATKGKDVITDFTPTAPDTTVVIDFQDLGAGPQALGAYGGLLWSNASAAVPAGGNAIVLKDGPDDVVGYANNGSGITLTAAQSFDLVSIDVAGFTDSVVDVFISVFHLDGSAGFLWIPSVSGSRTIDLGGFAMFHGIDGKVTITGEAAGSPAAIAFDNLRVVYPGSPGTGGDTIDLPDGADVAAVVASAVSNGEGGTVLTHAQGKLELLGVDPGTVSADWFV